MNAFLTVFDYFRKNQSNYFTINDVQRATKLSRPAVTGAVLELARRGLLDQAATGSLNNWRRRYRWRGGL